jgi:ubiquinone/menaquinone biosynthesis C-methylase UbiE
MTQGNEQVQEFWQDRARQENVDASEVTHRDIWQRWLEIETIKPLLKPNDRVIDIGCGNGYTTKRIARLVREIVGADYSDEMIRRAQSEPWPEESAGAADKASFQVCDVLELSPEFAGTFDVAITERCLINLSSWEQQQQALANIASVLNPGGRLIFIEGSKNGRDQLNEIRMQAGLDVMPTVWHNIDFEEQQLLEYTSQFFEVDKQLHFGVYDFIARVVHPLTVAPEQPKYDARINQVAAQLALQSQEYGHISRVLFLVLKKK